MGLSNTPKTYGSATRTLHWLVAAVVLTAFPLGFVANRLPLTTDAEIARALELFSLHKTVGVTAFAVGIVRIGWALTQRRPAPLHPERGLETAIAATIHWTLYLSLVVVPLSGWITHASTSGYAPILWPLGQGLPLVPLSETVTSIAGGVHWVGTKVLAVAILLHVGGTLKHAVIDRDATLRRMISGTEAGAETPAPAPKSAGIAAAMLWVAALGLGIWLGASRPDAPKAPVEAAAPSIWTIVTASATLDGREVPIAELEINYEPEPAALTLGRLTAVIAGRPIDLEIIDGPDGRLALGLFGNDPVELDVAASVRDRTFDLSASGDVADGRLELVLTAVLP